MRAAFGLSSRHSGATPTASPTTSCSGCPKEEHATLRSQNAISKSTGRGGRRHPPYAITEQGVAMLSSVLRSPRAVQSSSSHADLCEPSPHARHARGPVSKAGVLRAQVRSATQGGLDAIREPMAPPISSQRTASDSGQRRRNGPRTPVESEYRSYVPLSPAVAACTYPVDWQRSRDQ